MAFNQSEFNLHINLLTAAQRVLKRDSTVDFSKMVLEVFPSDHEWYRLVTKGNLVLEGVSYGTGLHKMDPTEGGKYTYNAMGEDLSYIDIKPGKSNKLISIRAFTSSQDITAKPPVLIELSEEPAEAEVTTIDEPIEEYTPGSTIVLVHHYAEIIGEDGDNMKPMFILESGNTIHVNTLDGQIVAAFEFEQ